MIELFIKIGDDIQQIKIIIYLRVLPLVKIKKATSDLSCCSLVTNFPSSVARLTWTKKIHTYFNISYTTSYMGFFATNRNEIKENETK